MSSRYRNEVSSSVELSSRDIPQLRRPFVDSTEPSVDSSPCLPKNTTHMVTFEELDEMETELKRMRERSVTKQEKPVSTPRIPLRYERPIKLNCEIIMETPFAQDQITITNFKQVSESLATQSLIRVKPKNEMKNPRDSATIPFKPLLDNRNVKTLAHPLTPRSLKGSEDIVKKALQSTERGSKICSPRSNKKIPLEKPVRSSTSQFELLKKLAKIHDKITSESVVDAVAAEKIKGLLCKIQALLN